jgi:hypothetical protein
LRVKVDSQTVNDECLGVARDSGRLNFEAKRVNGEVARFIVRAWSFNREAWNLMVEPRYPGGDEFN